MELTGAPLLTAGSGVPGVTSEQLSCHTAASEQLLYNTAPSEQLSCNTAPLEQLLRSTAVLYSFKHACISNSSVCLDVITSLPHEQFPETVFHVSELYIDAFLRPFRKRFHCHTFGDPIVVPKQNGTTQGSRRYNSTCAVIVYYFMLLQLHAVYQTIVIYSVLRKIFDRGVRLMSLLLRDFKEF